MESLAFHPVFSNLTAAVFLWAAAAAVSYFLMRRCALFSAGQRRILFLFRLAFLAVFALLLLRPCTVREIERPLPAAAAVLLDSSKSMSVSDYRQGRRYEAALSLLREGRNADPDLFHFFRFDGELFPLEAGEELPAEPDGEATALGSALGGVLERYSGQRLIGILVLSDGAQRAPGTALPQEAALRCRDAGVPVYTACVGVSEGGSFRDASVEDLAVPQRVYVGNEAAVSGFLCVSGYKGVPIPVLFSVEGETAGRCEFTPASDEERIPFLFNYTCSEPGQKRMTVSIPGMPGEITPVNNSADAYLLGTEGHLRVLFLEGARRFEDKFIRMALDSKQEMTVDYVRVSNRKTGAGTGQDTSLPDGDTDRTIQELIGKYQYSAVIVGDLDPADLRPETLGKVKELAESGAGLIFLPGTESIAAAKLGDTPLAPMIPVILPGGQTAGNRSGEGLAAPLEEALRSGGEVRAFADRPFKVRPAETARMHYLANLASDGEESATIWKELPPLESILSLEQIGTGAAGPKAQIREGSTEVLEGCDDAGNILPVLIVGSTPAGRSALLLSDTTWRWAMSPERPAFENFWRQLVLWAARQDVPPPGRLDPSVEPDVLLCGDPARFRVVYTPFQPDRSDGAALTAWVEKPDGTRETVELDEAGRGRFAGTGQAGEHRFCVTASENGRTVEETRRFLVKENGRELAHPAAAGGVMRGLAEMTGGECLPPESAAVFYEKMRQKGKTIIDRTLEITPLAENWGIFFCGAALLTGEWLLRRRWGRF